MSRYTVISPWRDTCDPHEVGRFDEALGDYVVDTFVIQAADIKDTKSSMGTTYRQGAFRVLKNGKPIVRGKGGTVPFYGELAWADAERLFNDNLFAARRAS